MNRASLDLFDFIGKCPTSFQAKDEIEKRLLDESYVELQEGESWSLEPCGRYYVLRGNGIIAFRIPEGGVKGFNIASTHTDSPSFKIKQNSEIESADYKKFSVEKYGGMIKSAWFDRPLGVAGTVTVDSGNTVYKKNVFINRGIAIIPSVPPHLSKGESTAFDMYPLFSDSNGSTILDIISDKICVSKDKILSHELFLVNIEKGTFIGENEEFIGCPRLDDLQCVYSALTGFVSSIDEENVPVFVALDNEEVGSMSYQGANSTFLGDTLYRIIKAVGGRDEEYFKALSNSFVISADNAHALHPNHPELFDSANAPRLNGGIVIKHNASKRYATEAEGSAMMKKLCALADVPYQEYTNHSDIVGGTTLGGISISHVSVRTADIGLPELAMHSSFECGGANDTEFAIRMFELYFGADISFGKNSFTVMV